MIDSGKGIKSGRWRYADWQTKSKRGEACSVVGRTGGDDNGRSNRECDTVTPKIT